MSEPEPSSRPRSPRPSRRRRESASRRRPSCRWRRSSAARRRSPRSSPTTAAGSPLEELRHECGVSRDGSKASNVLQAPRASTASTPRATSTRSSRSSTTLPFPVILFWNFNHFVVLEGFGKGKAYLNDPAQGPRDDLAGRSSTARTRASCSPSSTGPEFKKGGQAAEHAAGAAAAPGRVRERRCSTSCCAACCWSSRAWSSRPSRASSSTTTWSASQEWIVRPLLWFMAGDRRRPGGPDLAAALLPAAPRDQARARHVEPVLQPHPAPAGRLLRPALRRRDRLARRDQRQGRQDHRRASSRRRPSTAS